MIKLNHTVKITPKIQELLINLEAKKVAIQLVAPAPQNLATLRRQSLLQSGLYSAKIEGNHLTPENFAHTLDKLAKLEVQNLLDTYTWLSHHRGTSISLHLIRDLHRRALRNLRSDAGQLRTEPTAVFDQAGVAIYLAPPAPDVTPLLKAWLEQIKTSNLLPIIQTIISHYQFEKIHPFTDGNGRVGRLLLTKGLYDAGLHFADLLGLEQYIHDSRSEYYDYLEVEGRDLTGFAIYMLRLLVQASDRMTESLMQPHTVTSLLPRRAEILAIIQDHAPCSADMLYRRFLAVPQSTIRYDLKVLQQLGLIRKLGTTRAARYIPST